MCSGVWCCFTDIVVPFLSGRGAETLDHFLTSSTRDHPFRKYAKFSEKLTFVTLWETQFGKFWGTTKSDMISLLWENGGICFEETIRFDAKTSLASRPMSCLIRLYIKPGDMTKEF